LLTGGLTINISKTFYNYFSIY